MSNLRNKVIKLAYENPELRKALLPLTKTADDCDQVDEIEALEDELESSYNSQHSYRDDYSHHHYQGRKRAPAHRPDTNHRNREDYHYQGQKRAPAHRQPVHHDGWGEGHHYASSELRNKVIRLAHENPELRKDLLPLLKEARSGDGFMFEKNDFGLNWRRDYESTVLLYWPLENIGKRGRRVEQRYVRFRCDESRTSWASTWADKLKKTSDSRGANKLLTKLLNDAKKECDNEGWEYYDVDQTSTFKGVDRSLPTPSSQMIEDIKGNDVSVFMNGREVAFSSVSDDKKWAERGYQIYDLTADRRERKKIDSVRDLLEKAKGYDQVEKILQSAKVRFDSRIRMDPMYQ